MMDWIKLSDRRPDGNHMAVIIYGRYAKDCPMSVFEARYDARRRCFRTDIKAKDVTHWMPLPDAPDINK